MPMDGRRIKIYYRGIQKLCTKCFGQHVSSNCTNEKIKWLDYIQNFIETNQDIQEELYGNWNTIIERENRQRKIDQDHYNSKNPQQERAQEEQQVKDTGGQRQDTQEHDQEDPVGPSIRNGIESQSNLNQAEAESLDEKAPNQQATLEELKAADFKLPESDKALKEVMDKLVDLGLAHTEATACIEKRRKTL
jgi:hypothetical protein